MVGLVALGGLTVFLLLAVLGAMRETVLLRGEVEALSELIKRPPPPSFAGEPVPERLSRVLDPTAGRAKLVAFVSPRCKPCEDLSDGLLTAVADGTLDPDDVVYVIWANDGDEAEAFGRRLPGAQRVFDEDGSIGRACEVRATPTLFLVSHDRVLTDFNLEGDVQWALNRISSNQLQPTF